MSEQIALIEFINFREPGNELREIAERRLCDLQKGLVLFSVNCVVMRELRRKIPCYKPSTGQTFESIIHAARMLGINKRTLTTDIYNEHYKYGVYPTPNK